VNARAKPSTVLLALVAGLLSLQSVSAAEIELRPPHKRYRHAYVEQVAYVPDGCRVGWWQTIQSGHVRPRWAMRCR